MPRSCVFGVITIGIGNRVRRRAVVHSAGRLALSLSLTMACAVVAAAQNITVDITSGHQTNTINPRRALGAGVDGVSAGQVSKIYTPTNVAQMQSAGFGPLTYRLYTELSVQDWHWNPVGTWSDSANSQGYWTGSTTSSGSIDDTFGYRLPARGFTNDQGNNDTYSRLDDGDTTTYWKSNPYLTQSFTGELDSLHPQWILVDLGAKKSMNAIKLNWANPYAVSYQVQYWTGPDAINNPAQGNWMTFPSGNITNGAGGIVTLKLSSSMMKERYIRVNMTVSSNTCDTHGSSDTRNCVGYALNEVYVGTLSGNTFTDLVHHAKNNSTQTVTYCSSVDPWHQPSDQVTDEEQPGLDLVFTSGVTNGLPAIISVGMLYGTPEDSAAQITYLENHGYSIGYVELGEEPDGQYILPEDYGTLYVQWAAALHAVDPNLKLGGPILQADQEVQTWPDSQGNVSWLNRFFNYLASHNATGELSFMSYEHYPYNPCSITWNQIYQEPAFTAMSLNTWKADGLPPGTPIFITESNVSYDFQEQQVDLFGALWHADEVGNFLTLGGNELYYYEYEPLPLFPASGCNSWGNFGMFVADNNSNIHGYDAQYFSAQMLTQQWMEPVDQNASVYPATSTIKDSHGDTLVTSYAVLRPDGQWSLLLVGKDQSNAHTFTVAFHDASSNTDHYFAGNVTAVTFGAANYTWHPNGANGYASPDGPAVASTVSGGAGTEYTIPKQTIMVLRGTVQ